MLTAVDVVPAEIWPAYETQTTNWPPRLPQPGTCGPGWQPLIQHWASSFPGAHAPGWARVSWNRNYLRYEFCFLGVFPRNPCRGLNAHAYRHGDVGEIFVHVPGSAHYVEIHVTPENQRLQVRWPRNGRTLLARKEASIQDYMVFDPEWVRSEATSGPDYWSACIEIPCDRLGLPALAGGIRLRTAVCRYDYTTGTAMLTSTALLSERNFHRLNEWNALLLC